MEATKKGWIVLSDEHPNSNETIIDLNSFDELRKDSIEKFIHQSGHNWQYWKRKYKFKCVKCIQTIQI